MATPASKFQPLPDEDAPPGRSPYDAIGMRDRVYTQTLDAMVKAPPVSDGQFSLRLKAPRYVDPPTYTPAQEKQAILGGTTLGRRVKGTWELLNDTTGEVLDSRTQIVARVPYVNDRGLIIHRGSHYAVANQPRLLPGIFVRTRSNGEPDVHVNTLPGNGVGHHYTLDQAKGMLNVRVGQSQAPLAPLLRLMGATDEEMKAAWGEDLFKSSTRDMPGPALKRLRQAFLRRPDASDDELLAKITSTQLSPDVTSRTLGAPLEKLDKHAVLAATRRLIALSRGEDEGDDRDDPSFQRVYSPEDLFSERIAKDSGYVRKRALQEAVRQGGSLKKLPSGLLTSQLEHVLLKSGLGQSLEETNALEALDKMTRVTRLGEGGIPSTQSIPPESRDVRPSQFGYVDHVRTPECYDLGTEVMTRRGWLYYTDLKDTDEVACLVQGRVEWFRPSAKVDYHYRGPMYSIRANGVDLLVTPEHRIFMLSVSETPLSFSPDGAWKVEEAWRAFSYSSFLLLCAGPAESNWLGMPIAAAQDSSTVGATVCVRKQHMSVRQDYEGTVWCLTVPGGLLYVRRRGENGGRGVWCGNSLRVGVDAFLANGVRKGDDGRLYARYRDARTGQMVWRTPNQISGLAVAVPGAEREKSDRIQVIRNGKWDYVNRKDVDLMPGPYQDYFSPLANLVPFTSAEKAHRLAMGSRMLTQALPLENAEAPLVQNAIPGTKGMRSYDEEFAPHAGAVRAAKDGRVIHVTDDSIFVRYADGKDSEIPLYRNHPNNRKTLLHQSPVVTEGQEFKAGQSLVRSNYTDPTGNAIAIGRNLRVAFLPFRGKNFEDATVISESGASALSSEHAYQHSLDPDPSLTQDRAKYLSLFATKHPREKLEALDEKGVVKPGRRVEYGDPLILAVKQRAQDGSRILKRGSPSWSDAAVTWEHEDPGVVTDVVYGKHGPTVLVRSVSAAKVGDKLSGRHGNKAIIADIIPDEQMPRDEQGRPFHVLLGPEGVTTRANPAQKYEMWLGKIAEKTGKPIKVEDFGDTGDLQEWVQKKLAMHGLSSTETVTDPETERPIKGVATGNMWLMKLGHMAESKEQARSGGSYTADDTPGKGGYSGSKRLGLLNVNSLMSHGAYEVLREAGSIRGTRSEDFWQQFMRGESPREPGEPTVYRKFFDNLHAAGVRVYRDKRKLHLLGLTRDDVHNLTGDRILTRPDTVRLGSLDPVAGGLFDKGLTGSHGGKLWAGIDLPEPMPSPVMEEPLRRLLGLTRDQYEGVIAGTHEIPGFGKGPQAFAKAFEKFDVAKELASARSQLQAKSAAVRDMAKKKLGYLKGMEKYDLHPRDFLFDRVPVLPPAWRPVSMLPSGTPTVADPNYLYGDLVRSVENLTTAKQHVGDAAGIERLAVYKAFKAVTGLGDPIGRKSQDKEVSGILQHVMGDSPKFSTLQRQLLSTPVDNVARGVIVPDPALDMDQVGMPEDMAFDSYARYVVRRMVRQGFKPVEAVKAVKDRTPLARKALQEEMNARPVFMDRAPVLHKFGIMGAKPVLVPGRAVRISPLVVGPYGADFDGDTMQLHPPATEAAIRRVEEMMPSRNLFSPSDFKKPNYAPGQQYQGGLYHASTARNDKTPETFATEADVVRALQSGRLDHGDPVIVLQPSTPARQGG